MSDMTIVPGANYHSELIKAALEVAVPLWIEKLKIDGLDSVDVQKVSQIVAEKGDIILYGSKKKGETAAAFDALASGIARLSFCPSGVTIFGIHFESEK